MTARTDRLLIVAFACSGAAALGYELLWTQLLSIALGHETLGMLGVLAGFFGGMAAGAAALHSRVRGTANPVKLFVRLELAAASYAAVSPFVLHAVAQWLPPLLGETAGDNDTPLALALSMAVSAVVLLPATFCMGATLPALVEARRRVVPREPGGRGVGRLYGANTLGATLGVLLTTYVLLPSLGLVAGGFCLAALGVGSAVLASRWAAPHTDALRETAPSDHAATLDASRDPDASVGDEPWLLLVVLAGTGALGVALEVIAVQVLSQLLENTIYTFANTLAVYLWGTALGAWAYTRWVKPAVAGRPATVLAGLLIAQAITVVVVSIALRAAPGLLEGLGTASAGGSPATYGEHLVAEFQVALVVFLLPTVVMGATFSHAVGLIAPHGVGRAAAVNTLGGALAPVAVALWIVPLNGYRDALFVVLYGYLLLFGVFTWFRRFSAKTQLVAILGVVVTTIAAPGDLRLAQADSDWETLSESETMMGLVIVSEQKPQPGASPQAKPLRKLQVGTHFRMGGALAFGERRMGHIPLLLHPAPTNALFLGVGTGATLGAVGTFDSLAHVDAVELVPNVLEQLHYFDDINGEIGKNEAVHLHAADARRFVAASDRAYDVIVADLFHPGRNGAGGLYAQEHFEAVRDHLAPGGLFAQWIPLYQVDRTSLELIVRTFTEVFPHARAWLGVYNVTTPAIALLGAADADVLRPDPIRIAAAVQTPAFASVLMQEPRDLFAAHLMGHEGLTAFAGPGPLNTDLSPGVMLNAPRVAYEGNRGRGWRHLLALLEAREALTFRDAPELTVDVERFGRALTAYLRAEAMRVDPGSAEIPALTEAAVLAYLEAYDAAPEFAPSRGLLYGLAGAEPAFGEQIFDRMLARTPDEARVYNGYLQHLRRQKNAARFAEVRAEAERRFGTPTATPAPQGP